MRVLAALIPFALALPLAAPALAQQSDDGTISVVGHGEVSAAPDTAFVTSGVTTQGATAREALDANSAAMSELIQTLKDAGIAERDIQTSGFSVNPNYVYSDARDENGYQLPPKISGYQVMNTVTVRVRALDTLGGVLDKAVTVGANTINGVSFSVADPADLLDQARADALADARRKAEVYEKSGLFELGDLHQISETTNYGQPVPMAEAMMFDRAASAVPVATGELVYSIDVQVTWEIDDNE